MTKRRNSYKTGDRFNQKAKDEGYRARSVYKLSEIQKRMHPFKSGQSVLDLGCAPGSWARYASEQVGRKGKVVGIDLQEVGSLAGCTLLQADVYEITADELRTHLGGQANVVMSDMAPNTSGDKFGDHVRQIEICERALELATELLQPGGAFICKVFEGEDAPGFVSNVRKHFTTTKRVRPEAVRRESVEFFVVGMGFNAP